jgi:antitoxin ParD1/3/4
MRTTMNVSLPKDLKRWVDEQVKTGGYGTASEYVRDLLRRSRERHLRRRIDSMLIEAADGGIHTVMDDADWTAIRSAARKAATKPAGKRR